jgi:hypothetical protein
MYMFTNFRLIVNVTSQATQKHDHNFISDTYLHRIGRKVNKKNKEIQCLGEPPFSLEWHMSYTFARQKSTRLEFITKWT